MIYILELIYTLVGLSHSDPPKPLPPCKDHASPRDSAKPLKPHTSSEIPAQVIPSAALLWTRWWRLVLNVSMPQFRITWAGSLHWGMVLISFADVGEWLLLVASQRKKDHDRRKQDSPSVCLASLLPLSYFSLLMLLQISSCLLEPASQAPNMNWGSVVLQDLQVFGARSGLLRQLAQGLCN